MPLLRGQCTKLLTIIADGSLRRGAHDSIVGGLVDGLPGFGEVDDWDLLDDEDNFDENGDFVYEDDEVWSS